jgi:RNA-directed DNA polymerase
MPSYFHSLSKPEHLHRAWKRLSKKKHSRGFDQQTIERFAARLDDNIQEISRDLRSGQFQFTPLLGCLLDKPGGGKRPLKIPAVRDRVVLKAIHILIAHKFRRYDLPCSFGYIRKIGCADAVKRVRDLAADGKVWVLEGDISKFFDTVDRPLLMNRFLREIRVPSLESLISRALRVEIGNLDAFLPFEREMFPLANSGIPQGGVLSPLLANFYLYPFDKAMTDAGFDLVRYADDFVVMCASEQRAREAYFMAQHILGDILHLTLHPLGGQDSKTKITLYSKGFSFLGLHFQGGFVRPTSKAVTRFREKISVVADPRQGYSLFGTLNLLRHMIDGWAHAYSSYDCASEFRSLDQHVRQELSRYLQSHDFMSAGNLVSGKQMQFLGVPALEGIRQRLLDQQVDHAPEKHARVA